MQPVRSFFIYLKDLVWCIPELFVLIKQCKEIMAQRRYSCQRKESKHVNSQGHKTYEQLKI